MLDWIERLDIINMNWRYIRYSDGNEELYNVREDPNEWYTLAGDGDSFHWEKKE